MAQPTTLYNDIWLALKQRGTCKVAVHPALQDRVIHAVINKKYYDAPYKFELAERSKRSKLSYRKSKSAIEFTLKETTNLKSISIGDI